MSELDEPNVCDLIDHDETESRYEGITVWVCERCGAERWEDNDDADGA